MIRRINRMAGRFSEATYLVFWPGEMASTMNNRSIAPISVVGA